MSMVCYKRVIWSLFQQIAWWHRPAEWALPWSRTVGCITGLASRKQLLQLFPIDKYGGKKHLQVNSWTPGTRGCVNLFKHNHYTSCNESHHLINLTRINVHSQDPSIFCKGEIGESKGMRWESPPLHLSSSWWGHWSLQPLQECDIAFGSVFS